MGKTRTEKDRILYLGIDPPAGVFHYPVIRTEKILSPMLNEALALWDCFTHVIFTSKNGVRHWPGQVKRCFTNSLETSALSREKVVIAIGMQTASEIIDRGGNPLIAPEFTQEGISRLLDTLDLESAFVLYPKSKKARPYLGQYLKKRKVPTFIFDLYDTLFQRLEPVPDLNNFDEIIFTSPSTVSGFSLIYSVIPRRITLTPIGPITKKALEQLIIEPL